MIDYNKGWSYGLSILFQLHGSAVLKAFIPALASTGVLIGAGMGNRDVWLNINDENRPVDHPYAIGALISAFTFLITFRANFAYNRYWEAATAVHQMLSKWMDCGMEMAAFHYQCKQYNDIRPPAFGRFVNLTNISRERERTHETTPKEMMSMIRSDKSESSSFADEGDFSQQSQSQSQQRPKWRSRFSSKALRPSRHSTSTESVIGKASTVPRGKSINIHQQRDAHSIMAAIPIPKFALHSGIKPRGAPSLPPNSASSMRSVSTLVSEPVLDGGIKTSQPSLFLQEAAHLISLLSAVAMSTLRNDMEGTESPLDEYIPGSPWPPQNPDDLPLAVRELYDEGSRAKTTFLYLLGITRGAKHRTLYNAARPFGVIGGVSDAEVYLLQTARGPQAKVALVSMWLQEFISREYLAGSTGEVHAPIISRLFQFTSDGMLGYVAPSDHMSSIDNCDPLTYNQARKIAYIPFPFPHAQLSSLFILVVILFLPILMFTFVNHFVLGCFLNFFTVACFVGLHEVARELEDPFFNIPNDLPLITFQAQFNEALLTMYAGFHPDSWWEYPDMAEGSRLLTFSYLSTLIGQDAGKQAEFFMLSR
eukprot:scaffold2529_cov57-Attheya_sp.AAC.3